MGQVAGVIPQFGNAEQLQEAVREMQWRIYVARRQEHCTVSNPGSFGPRTKGTVLDVGIDKRYNQAII